MACSQPPPILCPCQQCPRLHPTPTCIRDRLYSSRWVVAALATPSRSFFVARLLNRSDPDWLERSTSVPYSSCYQRSFRTLLVPCRGPRATVRQQVSSRFHRICAL